MKIRKIPLCETIKTNKGLVLKKTGHTITLVKFRGKEEIAIMNPPMPEIDNSEIPDFLSAFRDWESPEEDKAWDYLQ